MSALSVFLRLARACPRFAHTIRGYLRRSFEPALGFIECDSYSLDFALRLHGARHTIHTSYSVAVGKAWPVFSR
ncbi:hypothetical protein BDN72DRAFT_907346 [Pluteus cervinus]|uniref:Uncharacterized protein n=1 Tax=Pluteus cervinus TaxID=181527 RepID=A0ACD2ZWX6_9AGAR|nr:hypothetical protein BDN72DRAFT_907346 [Pluteus cervinus]